MKKNLVKIAAVASAAIMSMVSMGVMNAGATEYVKFDQKFAPYFGDANMNKRIERADSEQLSSLLEEYPNLEGFDSAYKERMDVNADDVVDDIDADIIMDFFYDTVVYGKTSVFGDADYDGKVDSNDSLLMLKYVNNVTLTSDIDLMRADVNRDGVVGMIDVRLVNKNILGTVNLRTVFGDVDGNGQVQTADATLINKYLMGTGTLTTEQRKLADVDADGTIDTSDSLAIIKYVNLGHFE